MSLQYIIDGYNLINHPLVARALKNPVGPRNSLINFIKNNKLTGSPKNKVIVVFDGYPVNGELLADDEQVRVVFARMISADEKIKMLVEESGLRKSIIVVSDDRGIAGIVSELGAKSLSIQEFAGVTDRPLRGKNVEAAKSELNYSQVQKINEELKKLWLKE